TATHHLQAEKRHFAEMGDSGPIDEERETASEVAALLKMARPNLDGDEQPATNRLRDALRARLARTPASGWSPGMARGTRLRRASRSSASALPATGTACTRARECR